MRYPVPTVVSAVLTRLRLSALEEVRTETKPEKSASPKMLVSKFDRPIRLNNPPLRRAIRRIDPASNM